MVQTRILIKPDKQPERSRGGIILPTTQRKRPSAWYGTVVSVGNEVKAIKPDYRVAFENVGVKYTEGGVDYTIILEENILLLY